MNLELYNSLTKKKEVFESLKPKKVGMYTCGPTVYNYAHIGNLRSYVFADVLKRTLAYFGYEVNQIMNITDIGHLSSDADSGEDKMTKGLLREGKELNLKNMRALAEFYTEKFNEDLQELNILPPSGQYYASDYIGEDIVLIERLTEKCFTYKTSDGVYFDTSKMPDYGILRGGIQKNEDTQKRIEENTEKKNPQDFALWKLNDSLGFDSPFGKGFPGWHIECSAMSIKFLGEQFDIHTGGIDHISIHHTNEIAQTECATGKKPFVKYWLHNEFVDTGGEKMAKSSDNFLRLQTLKEKGYGPIAYRLWLLTANYRTKVNFNWDALEASQIALKKLQNFYLGLGEKSGEKDAGYEKKFKEYLSEDLDTPRAISLLWDLLKNDEVKQENKKATILDFDQVLGLGFANLEKEKIPEEIILLAEAREVARENKNWQEADRLRSLSVEKGYLIEDTPSGPKIHKL